MIFETIIDIIFIFDIVMTFNTGFHKICYQVMKRREIVIEYMKAWFLIEIVASFLYS